MKTPESEEIEVAIDVLAALRKEFRARYWRREGRIPNNESCDPIETHLHYELRFGLERISDLRRESRTWNERLERQALREMHRGSSL